MQVLVVGPGGPIGRVVAQALEREGHSVVGATPNPDTYRWPGQPVPLDLDDAGLATDSAVRASLELCDAAYFLVGGLGRPDFETRHPRRAERFAAVWGRGRPLIHLAALGADSSAAPLLRASRSAGAVFNRECDTVEVRASVVIGGETVAYRAIEGISRLASRLPMPLLAPRALSTEVQPIAEADLAEALVRALDIQPGVYDVGGPDVVTFADLLERSASAQGRELRVAARLPVAPEWFGPAVALATGVNPRALTALMGAMGTPMLVRSARQLPGEPRMTSLADALSGT